ncbi:hypothetical protein BH23ACT5_BH23ACT5_15760 [soil metagenome]
MAEFLVATSYVATLGGIAVYATWLYLRHRSLGS